MLNLESPGDGIFWGFTTFDVRAWIWLNLEWCQSGISVEFLSIISEERLNISELRAWKITLEWFLMASLSQLRAENMTGTWDEAGAHFVTE